MTKTEPFRAVFIRAPAILAHGPAVEVLAEYVVPEGKTVAETQVSTVAVAVRQGQLLGTAFHPELTADTRWHRLFIDMCAAAPASAPAASAGAAGLLTVVPPPPLPVF
jgi:5'-phosphate synthase pdxT subunit